MDAGHDDSSVTQESAKVARAAWRRPRLRRLSARDAEVGVAVNVSDGAFTTS